MNDWRSYDCYFFIPFIRIFCMNSSQSIEYNLNHIFMSTPIFFLTLQPLRLNWSVSAEMAVDSSFFYGYLITQIPGGFLASAFPANRIFGTAIAVSAFLNLSVPGAMSMNNVTVLCIIRVFQGLVEVSDKHQFYSSIKSIELDVFTGRHISSVSWHLAILGTATGTFPIGHNGI